MGFVVRDRGRPLDPSSGLFVHTVTKKTAGRMFYAVTVSDAAGVEDPALRPGRNCLSAPVAARVEQPVPI